jgi:pimeloyl-ACP methyl ester carboxylesterase
MVRMLARGELVTIPGAGHAVLSDNPAASSAAIARFADATLRGSRS